MCDFKYLTSSILFIFLCLQACTVITPEENDSIEIESPVITQNISNQQITSFEEDAQGHIWIGTFRGLNKYNVHEYHQYFCTNDQYDLPDNQIKDMFRDSKNRLWVSTVNGLCYYTDKDRFQVIPYEGSNKNGIQILESKKGRIFINTISQLCGYEPQEDKIKCFIKDFDPQQTFNVRCFIDQSDNLWAVSSLALRCYDPVTLELKDSVAISDYPTYSFLAENGHLWLSGYGKTTIYDTYMRKFTALPGAIAKHSILATSSIDYIHPYRQGLILVTPQNGMFYYHITKDLVFHQDETGFPFEAPRFKVSKMFTDSQNNLWIGSVDQGYLVRYNYKERFNNNNYLRSCVENKSVIALAVDKQQHLWISTLMDGLYVFNLKTHEIEKPDLSSIITKQNEDCQINALFVDDENALWISQPPNSVLKTHYRNGKLQIENNFSIGMSMNITQDHNKTIWVTTGSNSIYYLNKGEKNFSSKFVQTNGFTFIPGIYPLSNGHMLITAFNNPLKWIDQSNGDIVNLDISKHDYQKSIPRSVMIPTAVYEDKQGYIWIGTVSNGLLRYSLHSGRLEPVPGTACTDISGIEEDFQGNIWVSTLYGLSRYDRTVDKFTHYYAADGIGGNQFYDRSSCRLPDGTLVFGGTHGLTFFNPIDITDKRKVQLLFQDLKIHNRLIQPSDKECFDKHLSYNPHIKLKHDQNSFSISFAALDYCEYERVRYSYQMEGYDKYMIDARNNRAAYYANLPPGNYVFTVKISNNNQSIVETASSIRITVSPAPWNSWWARCIYLFLLISLVILIIKTRLRIKREHDSALQAEQEKRQEQKINQMNMSFFANISHEFRTPLSMISGPVSQLAQKQEFAENERILFYTINRNVNRMLRLVNQLMDFNKLENDTLKLKVTRMDIIPLLSQIIGDFKINARHKHINLISHGVEDSLTIWFDTDKIDKILNNLLSNALKFTPTGGKIDIYFDVVTYEEVLRDYPVDEAQKESEFIKICISDSGRGIPEDKLERIFERYYQIDNQTNGNYNWGTGIGLYYARCLAELHHGYLKAANRYGEKGAEFTLILPINEDCYSSSERSFGESNIKRPKVQFIDMVESEDNKEENPDLKKIMIIDDDEEIVYYLRMLLADRYKVIYYFDVNSALSEIQAEAPDLIISDVVMPDKTGYQFCKEIKDDLQICHIPIILVTAKITVENQVEGLEKGADAYVTKPFEPDYLLALINSLLKNRDKIRNLLGNVTQTEDMESNILSPQDKSFMTELYELMSNELSNPELDVTRMTSLLKISRTKFYYKVKGLTGENPSVFFKTYKLNKAAEFICEGKYTISEIADMTGFNTLSHFSTSFKKRFGVSPSEYKKK